MKRWHRRGIVGSAAVALAAVAVAGAATAVGADSNQMAPATGATAAYDSHVTITWGAVDNDASAQQLWAMRGPASYRYVWTTSAMVGSSYSLVEVRDGRVVSRTPLAGPMLRPEARAAPTIEEVFARLRDAQELADRVRIAYDTAWGYPTSVEVDRSLDAADDEYGFGVEAFEPL